ncbi:MAG: PEGA domain-containing protein [Myxococcota bacterium]|nr:PEGA domain-containing protein [Myxococcota bacterium]
MFSRFVSFALALALALPMAAAPAAAQEDDRERARTEFQRGVDAYGRADYQTALSAFQEAYRLAPHPVVRVNIANSYEQLGRPLEALFHFEQFLTESERATPQQRREVETAIRRLRSLVGEIELHVSPDGALVTIDGTEQRRAPVTAPVRVTAGQHTVEVQLDGYTPERRQVEVQGGQTSRVDVRLARAEVAAASAGTTTETTTSTSGATTETSTETTAATGASSTIADPGPATTDDGGGFEISAPAWIAGGITIAAAIGAGVTGGLALSANSEFDGHVATYEDPLQPASVREQARLDGLSSADTASTLALVSDILLVTTLVGAGATVFFLITTQDGEMLSDEQPRVAAAPLVGDGLAGVLVIGAF